MALHDRFSGIAAKLQRANQTIAELKGKVSEFERTTATATRIEKGFLESPTVYSVRALNAATVPTEFAVIAGEIIHALRSSLDHLVCALALEAGGDVRKSHQYPICQSTTDFQKAIQRGLLADLSDAAIAQIESLQPYHSPEPRNHAMAVVNELDNRDKHRLLIAAGSTTFIPSQIEIHGGVTITHLSGPNPVTLGAEFREIFRMTIAEPISDVRLEFEMPYEVALIEVGDFSVTPMMLTIEQCFEALAHVIGDFIPHFS